MAVVFTYQDTQTLALCALTSKDHRAFWTYVFNHTTNMDLLGVLEALGYGTLPQRGFLEESVRQADAIQELQRMEPGLSFQRIETDGNRQIDTTIEIP